MATIGRAAPDVASAGPCTRITPSSRSTTQQDTRDTQACPFLPQARLANHSGSTVVPDKSIEPTPRLRAVISATPAHGPRPYPRTFHSPGG
jgi:hypothetical protein